ncbi:alpha/beta-hydrolase [Artomyces pyxidatus]|uniref:Alpha/beta-hydrolase n=1 Tax=Artomyces pyxidatus TaxID=48021 RepID=A0ACB8SXM4_9AGAM|nr:alpha/beta-hydrolase [Artomyces pyxidatus]
MPALESKAYVFDPRPLYPLLISVKRYWVPGFESDDPTASTLILAHGTSFHNEHWEPVIEDLYSIIVNASTTGIQNVKIRDAWAIECPNHGDSAILNEAALAADRTPVFSWVSYGKAIHAVLSGQGKGLDVDFRTRNLVGVGHSMGAVSIVLSRMNEPAIPWQRAVLVEPMILHPDFDDGSNNTLAKGARRRRDVWASRDEARKIFLERSFKTWDPRLVDIYVRYGLRDLPTALHPDKAGVTLKCTKAQEEATYTEAEGRLKATSYLSTFCTLFPTHAIFGAIGDVVPAQNRDYIIDTVAQGKFKTVHLVQGAGHLAAHHNPTRVAELLCDGDALKF